MLGFKPVFTIFHLKYYLLHYLGNYQLLKISAISKAVVLVIANDDVV